MATLLTGFTRAYEVPFWLTAKQVADHGGTVLPHEAKRATSIIFTGRYKRKVHGAAQPEANADSVQTPESPHANAPDSASPATSSETGAAEPKTEIGRFTREFHVYNLAQTKDVRLPKKMAAYLEERANQTRDWTPDKGLAEIRRAILASKVAPIFFDRVSSAHYNPGTHEIHCPKEECFRSELDMWETLAHEVVHATGAKFLLARPQFVNPKGKFSDEYALEELTAVMGSLFICQDTGVAVTEERARNWAAYIEGYGAVGILEKNPSLFVQAIVRADFAAQFVLHPELRPDFVRNRIAPSQVEFTFDEFSPQKTYLIEPVDGAKLDEEIAKANEAAKALEQSDPALKAMTPA